MKRLIGILLFFSIVVLGKHEESSVKAIQDSSSSSSSSSSQSDFHFTKNEGQFISEVLYHCKLHVGDILFKDTQFTFDLFSSDDIDKFHDLRHNHLQDSISSLNFNKHIYHMNFLNANTDNLVVANEELSFKKNYFKGNDPNFWSSDVSSYRSLVYKDLYNGIDVNIYSVNNQLKYDYVVSTYSDPEDIIVEYEGITDLRLIDGVLEIILSNGEVRESAPFAYQIINGKQFEIVCEFVLDNNLVRFDFPYGYDSSEELIIDPTLVFSTLTGSASDNWGFTATYDDDGNFYAGSIVLGGMLGWGSGNFDNYANYPVTGGAYQTSFGGFVDVAISKFSPDGTTLIYSTYLGGNQMEEPHSLVCDDQNNLIIMGATSSTNFPTTTGAYQSSFGGGSYISYLDGINWSNGSDIFVTKLNASGSSLIGSTYIGGSSNDGLALTSQLNFNYADHARGEVILDDNNDIYIASSTASNNFPTTVSSHSQSLSGSYDGVVCKFSSSLDNLIWSTYIGGSSADAAYSIRVDNVNNQAVICGGTTSNNIGATSGVINPVRPGGIDGYVATFSNTIGALNALTYLGTTAYDQSYILEIDDESNIYVTGQTKGNYLVTAGTYNNPGSNQFIHKLSSDLTTTVFSTVFGSVNSSSIDISLTAFLVDNCGNIYVAGWGGITSNYEGDTYGMPVTSNAIQPNTDGSDFYFIVLGPDATSLIYATYFGGTGGYGEHVDGGTSRFDKEGMIYQGVCASCGGGSFPTTPGVYSSTNGSSNCNYGGIKIDFEAVGVMANASASPNTSGCVPLTVNFSNTSTANSYLWDFDDNNQTSTLLNPSHTFVDTGLYEVMLIAVDSLTCNISDTAFLSINVFNPTSNSATLTECDSYTWPVNNQTYNSSGIYTDISNNAQGCIHTETLNLTINNSTSNTVNLTECEFYTWPITNQTYNSSGIYTDISTNAQGCTHTEILNLTINNSTSNTVNLTECDAYTWPLDGNTYTSTGLYNYTTTNIAGCDSLITLDLIINSSNSSLTSFISCDPITWNGQTYNSSGNYVFLSTNINGCDSIANLDLSITFPTFSTTTLNSCDSVLWNGDWYNTSGIYDTVFSSTTNYIINGDFETNSAVGDLINLTNSQYNSSMSNSFAFGDYLGGGPGGGNMDIITSNTWCGSSAQSGNWYVALTGGGTDAISLDLSANLVAGNNYTITFYSRSCWSQSSPIEIGVSNINNNFGSLVYTSSIPGANAGWVQYTASFTAPINASYITVTCGGPNTVSTHWTQVDNFILYSSGCDSTATLDLTIDTVTSSFSSIVSCDPIVWNGTNYSATGMYTHIFNNTNGCDSIATLDLIINSTTSSAITIESCDPIVWNGQTYNSSGVYTYITTNASGCDSVVTLDLTIFQSTSSNTLLSSCDPVIWNGQTYSSSGNYSFLTTNSNGCDSVANLSLTINNATSSTTTLNSCVPVLWNGQTYSSSGSYSFLTTNSNGCDSTANLNLVIGSISTSSVNTTQCDIYNWNGQTYNSSGTYTYITTNSSGCDSIVTLDLTIFQSTLSNTLLSSCDPVIWNGQTYSSSGNYSFLTTNSNGCDSIANLSLNINNVTSSTTTLNSCVPVVWNGQTYSSSGNYSFLTTNSNGCDSTANLNLVIGNASVTANMTVDACKSYYWNGTDYVNSGIYSYTTTNSSGCDSTIILTLNIFNDDMYFPNTFTPNTDNINDRFIIHNNLTEFKMWIFNRWGEEVFYTEDGQLGWDGKYKNKICEDGVYTWRIVFMCGKEIASETGQIHLLK